jgi:hypothetical protein
VNALANEKVGEFFAKHIVATYQKVGTFQIVNGQKQGGNVASYFCLGDGTVLHAIAGPVDADTMLREAKWVVETRKMALVEGPDKYSDIFRRAHADRLMTEYGVHVDVRSPVNARNAKVAHKMDVFARQAHARRGDGNNALLVHKLLAEHSLPKIETIYKYVFETILNQKISTQPVNRIGA